MPSLPVVMDLFPKYLPAGALLLAILMATLIAAGTAGLLLLLQYQRQYAAQTMRHERLQQNLASATNLLLADHNDATNGLLELNLFDGDRDSIMLSCQPWGVFDVAIAYAYEGMDTLRHAFIMGKVPAAKERFALYLADERRPLSLSGHTRIQGDAYIPEAGIRKSYIENEAYAYEEVVHDGTIHISNSVLPELDVSIVERLYSYLQPADTVIWKTNADNWFNGLPAESRIRRFSDDCRTLYGFDSLVIDRQVVSGHVVIVANRAITVGAGAQLDNVLLFAPHIRFEQGFEGRLQAFARDSLIVENNCRFDYPSVLGLINIPQDTVTQELQPFIRIDSASTINGLVFSHFAGSEQLLAKIVLGKETAVHGQVYADGLLELQGRVDGMTLCRRFTLQTASSLYENFVLNGVMDLAALSPYYAGSPLLLRGRLRCIALSVDTSELKRTDVN